MLSSPSAQTGPPTGRISAQSCSRKTKNLQVTASSASADTAQPCNQLLNPDPNTAFICIAANAFNQYGADYRMDEAYQRMQAIHPADGLLDVSDAYYCRPSKVVIGGHVQSVNAGSTPTESYCARGAPEVPVGEAEWQARNISVYDGHGFCVVYHWKVVDTRIARRTRRAASTSTPARSGR
jgi:hypothetical protein